MYTTSLSIYFAPVGLLQRLGGLRTLSHQVPSLHRLAAIRGSLEVTMGEVSQHLVKKARPMGLATQRRVQL
jgi:hypothetical protein